MSKKLICKNENCLAELHRIKDLFSEPEGIREDAYCPECDTRYMVTKADLVPIEKLQSKPKKQSNIRSVSAEYKRKINPKLYDSRRGYESIELKMEAWKQIRGEDDPLEETRALQEFCRERVVEQALPIIKRLSKNNNAPIVKLGTVEYVFRTFCEASLDYLNGMEEEEKEEAIDAEWKEFSEWLHSSEV